MPDLDTHWSVYKDYTEELSRLSRQLAFGDAAICWFFKTPEATFPDEVIHSLAYVVLFFTFEVLQYFSGALFHRGWLRYTEYRMYRETGSLDGEVEKPAWLDWPAFTLFILKIGALFLAFYYLGLEFLSRMG